MPKSLSSISLSACVPVKTIQQKHSQQACFAANCQQNNRAECITPTDCLGKLLDGEQHFCQSGWLTMQGCLCLCEHLCICAVTSSQVRLWCKLWYYNHIGCCVNTEYYPTWKSDRKRANHDCLLISHQTVCGQLKIRQNWFYHNDNERFCQSQKQIHSTLFHLAHIANQQLNPSI